MTLQGWLIIPCFIGLLVTLFCSPVRNQLGIPFPFLNKNKWTETVSVAGIFENQKLKNKSVNNELQCKDQLSEKCIMSTLSVKTLVNDPFHRENENLTSKKAIENEGNFSSYSSLENKKRFAVDKHLEKFLVSSNLKCSSEVKNESTKSKTIKHWTNYSSGQSCKSKSLNSFPDFLFYNGKPSDCSNLQKSGLPKTETTGGNLSPFDNPYQSLTTEGRVSANSGHTNFGKRGGESNIHHEYCIIGAGPAGLQLGYFLSRSNRNYVIFERANQSGSFFSLYPRHRQLISINKRCTGRSNAEFNLRHDWNSLLSDDPSLLYQHFSAHFFPHADTMVHYLNAFAARLSLNILYNTDVSNINKEKKGRDTRYIMSDQRGKMYSCRTLIVATGLHVPSVPSFQGSNLTEGYEEIPVQGEKFRGKNVLILGRGNAAFETADALYGHTNMVHMLSRSRARLAWSTHYVGDLRAVNNNLLDTYQLKSLDGLLEANVEDLRLTSDGSKIRVSLPFVDGDEDKHFNSHDIDLDNFALREKYDHVIRCLGFKFNFTIFQSSNLSGRNARLNKYPSIKGNYESTSSEGLFFAGTATHSLDYRRSAGGFIHGFRYSVRALHRLLEWRFHHQPWPSSKFPTSDIVNRITSRINQASGPYQMFGELADLFFINSDQTVTSLEEVPIALLGRLGTHTGHTSNSPLIILVMEYGEDFSGVDKDPFRADRAVGDVFEAHRSNFLHPVLYYYNMPPNELSMMARWRQSRLPRPDKLHHILEDFLTDWTAKESHILPLRRFLEDVLQEDLKHQFAEDCLLSLLTTTNPQFICRDLRDSSLRLSLHL